MAKIIVSGGCGYIGSHTIIDLVNNGFEVISIDNHVRSSAAVSACIEAILGKKVQNYEVDLCDESALQLVFQEHADAVGVIHFAALKSVPESVQQPLLYYHNNLQGLCNILQAIEKFSIDSFIFSSSCSVYGNTTALPVVETTPLGIAESPYAATKQMGERIIEDFIIANPNKKAILLRYFNPGGAHPSGLLGEMPQKGISNLIPILMEAILGIRPELTVHGGDYDTRDGTCIRDYIHIMDLADAHTRALRYLVEGRNEQGCEVFNVGIGEGVTVLEAIKAIEQASSKKVPYLIGPRRAGDVVAIYANYERAARLLGWQPRYNINDIMATAWTWELNRRKAQMG
jgi:UDP-glucose 4-epimerase